MSDQDLKKAILRILFRAHMNGTELLNMHKILSLLHGKEDTKVDPKNFFDPFTELLDEKLIELVETVEITVMYFRITDKGRALLKG